MAYLYEGVVHYFFKHYQPTTDEILLRFSRRPDGYYVEKYTSYMQPEASELFFSFADQDYRALSPVMGLNHKRKDFPQPTVHPAAGQGITYLQRFQYWTREMGLVPYYGYAGWYKDVMAAYELNLAVQIRIQVCEMANEWPMPQLQDRCY